ncbi:MFS transporter [Candidatus Kaiserbacteria bacterium]|nr:MFS transporter [Candidatus Kaiserbacteria bacterium]
MNKQATILVWSSNIWNFGDGLLGPLFAVFAQKVGGNVLDIAWAWGVYLIVMGVGVIIVGTISDRVPKLPLLFAGYILSTICTFAYLLVDSTSMLLLVQAGIGLAIALANPTYFALLAKNSSSGSDGALWGWADGRDKIATGLAVFAGGLIVAQAGFQVLFVVMGVLQFFAVLYLAQLFRKPASDTLSS